MIAGCPARRRRPCDDRLRRPERGIRLAPAGAAPALYTSRSFHRLDRREKSSIPTSDATPTAANEYQIS